MEINFEPLLTAAEVAAILRISKSEVYRQARRGQLPAVYPLGKPTKPSEGKKVRFRRADIQQIIERGSS